MRTLRTLLVVVVLALAACSSGDGAGPAEVSSSTPDAAEALDLTGSWVLTSGQTADGQLVLVEGAPVTLEVTEEGQVSGTSGCNRYTGEVTVEGGTVSFGPLASTLMACVGDVMVLESAYLSTLEAANAGERADGTLTLSGDGGGLVFAAA